MFRKIISAFTTITVICWLSGLALLIPIHTADAVINEGDLIRGPDGIKVYIVNASNYKRHIFNPDVFDMYGHFTWDSIQEVDQAVLDSYTTSDLYRVDVEHQVYSVGEDGIKHWLDMTAEQFVSEGYSWNQVFIVNAVEGAYYTVGSEITPEPVVPEGLTLALADDTPAAASIPYGSSIEFVKFTLTADEDVNINSIKITAGGIGTYTDIDSVAIFDEDGARLSSIKTISSDGTAIFNFSTPIEVVTGITRTLTVKAAIDKEGAGSLFKLGIANAADIVSNATAVGGAEVYGNPMSILDATVGSSVITAANSAETTYSFGEDNVLVADFEVSAKDDDLLFSGIAFKNGGTRDDDLISNLKLACDGEELDTAELVDNYVTFNFSNVEIEDGDKAICEVRGDLGIGSDGDTIKLYLEDASDVNLLCKTSGFGASVDIEDLDIADEAEKIKLSAGDFTIDFDRLATPNKDVRPDTDNVVLATLKLTSNAEDATVESIDNDNGKFEIQGSDNMDKGDITAGSVEMRDVDTGSIYDLKETTDTTFADKWYLELSEEISLLKGVTKTFEIRVDLDDGIGDGDTLKIVLEDGAMTITGDVSGESITDITPSSITSATATVETSSLTVTPTTLTTTKIVGGAADVIIYQGTFEAGDSSLVTLKKVIISETAAGQFSNDNITKLDLYLDGELMDSKSGDITEITGNNSITFSSLTTNNVIPAGETVDLVLKATFASSLTEGNIELEIADADANVISRDADNNVIKDPALEITAGASRTVTLADKGTLKVELLTTDTRANKNMYTVAGSSGPSGRYLGELVFTTANEPIRVTELNLVQYGDADANDIASVSLVDKLGDVVITQAVKSDGDVEFTNADLEFPADEATSYFIVANTKDINVKDAPTSTAISGRTIQYHLLLTAADSVVAEGVDSGEDVVVTISDEFPFTFEDADDGTAAWSTTDKNTGSYSAKLTVTDANDNASVTVPYGLDIDTIPTTSVDSGTYKVVDQDLFKFWLNCTGSTEPIPMVVLGLDTTGDGAVDFELKTNSVALPGAAVPITAGPTVWTQLSPYADTDGTAGTDPTSGAGGWLGKDLTAADSKYYWSGAAWSASFGDAAWQPLGYWQKDEDVDTKVDSVAGATVVSVSIVVWGDPYNGIAYVDDITINDVPVEASKTAIILGGAVTFIENDMADGTLTTGAGKIIGKYAVSIDTGSNRNTDNTPMEVVLTTLKITPNYNSDLNHPTDVRAYIEGDSSNKTDAGTDATASGTAVVIDLTDLDGEAYKVTEDVVLVIVATIGGTPGDDYIQTEINGLGVDFTYTDSSAQLTPNGGNCRLTISEVIGGTLSN